MASVCFLLSKPYSFQNDEFAATLAFKGSDEDKFNTLSYSFEIKNNLVVKELLVVDNTTIIKRTESKATLKKDEVFPPEHKLLTQVRRDKILFPHIEALMDWAERVTVISLSTMNPFTIGISKSLGINPIEFSELVNSFSSADKSLFIKEAESLGYKITDIRTARGLNDQSYVEVNERYAKQVVDESLLSNGMLRVLYLLAFIIKMKDNEKRLSLLLIDDLGEGLDYKKATDLCTKVFDACNKYKIQLIASSNDGFIMDVVDLSNWQVLQRKNSKVTALNNSNHPALFEEFYYTGLSNFDFFASDFINNFLHHKQ